MFDALFQSCNDAVKCSTHIYIPDAAISRSTSFANVARSAIDKSACSFLPKSVSADAVEVVDDPYSAALSHSLSSPPKFADSARSFNQVTGEWCTRQVGDQAVHLALRDQGGAIGG